MLRCYLYEAANVLLTRVAKWSALTMPDHSAAADRLDYWIRRHAVQLYCGTHSAQKKSKSNPALLAGLSAIGQGLKGQYDALASPVPPHLTALVEQLKMDAHLQPRSVVAAVVYALLLASGLIAQRDQNAERPAGGDRTG
jgi:hypothetical protein